jgi:glucose/arabinose dehydrogenase/uncharacterized protein YecT (DUF1311 family)
MASGPLPGSPPHRFCAIVEGMRQYFIAVLAITVCFSMQASTAASFDCSRARTSTEKLVCSDPTLSRLDEQLDDACRSAQRRVASRPALRDAQRSWLSNRRDVCNDAPCLRAAYLARIDALLDEATANPTTETLELNATRARETYAAPQGTCGGFPRLPIGMAAGMCAGLIAGPTQADPTRTIRMPRALLELEEGSWLVTDLGAWTGRTGAVWRIRTDAEAAIRIEPVIGGLQLPHTIARGPDRRVYVSEMGRIFRFDPGAADPAATIETVIANLPDNTLHAHRHPIASFLFDADGALLVNVGAPSDQCLSAAGKPGAVTCVESEQGDRAASIRRYATRGADRWSDEYTVHASGLRNSIALARHATGTILQGENSFDFEARLRPFEEINLIEAGSHYGWPYCYDNDTPSPGWKGMDVANCDDPRFTAPKLLLPPHSSPLAMLWYDGDMFTELKGRLLVSLHGFRSVGGRIVAYETDADGIPRRTARATFPVYGGTPLRYGSPNAAEALVLTPEWNKVVGVRPQGSPVGLAVAADGAIWTTDDRAGLVIRIAKDVSR